MKDPHCVLGSLNEGEKSPLAFHHGILEQVLEGTSAADSWVRSFNGFSASDDEGEKLASTNGVVSVFPSRTLQPQVSYVYGLPFACIVSTH